MQTGNTVYPYTGLIQRTGLLFSILRTQTTFALDLIKFSLVYFQISYSLW